MLTTAHKVACIDFDTCALGMALQTFTGSTVDFVITTQPPLLAHVRSGKLRALMVTGRTRLAV